MQTGKDASSFSFCDECDGPVIPRYRQTGSSWHGGKLKPRTTGLMNAPGRALSRIGGERASARLRCCRERTPVCEVGTSRFGGYDILHVRNNGRMFAYEEPEGKECANDLRPV
jgi:hypothetical protein